MRYIYRHTALLTALLALPTLVTAQLPTAEVLGIYVGNQGNFSDNNGSVTYIDIQADTSMQILEDFGTLVQSLTLYNDKVYVMSNTSNSVDVIDVSINMRESQITSVPTPRYLAATDENRAYVSNLYSATVTIIDLLTNSVVGTIPTGANPEGIAVVDDWAFVANSGFGHDSTISIIDITNDTVVNTVDLGCDGPRHLAADEESEVWVFCNGKTVWNSDYTAILEQTNGAVAILDGTTGAVKDTIALNFQVGAATAGQDAFYSPWGQEIFLVHNSEKTVLAFSTATNEYKETIKLAGDEPIGAVAYNVFKNEFYAARLNADNPYTAAGFVSVHSRDGSLLRQFPAGIAPAHIALKVNISSSSEARVPLPEPVDLLPPYPNPFTDQTTLSFGMNAPGHVRLSVVDALGRTVSQPLNQSMPAGTHQVVWDANGLAPGIYFVHIAGGGQHSTRKLVLVR